jgi:hypothetical protein
VILNCVVSFGRREGEGRMHNPTKNAGKHTHIEVSELAGKII